MPAWKTGANGYWTDVANWDGGVPNGSGAVADFIFSSPTSRTNVVSFQQNDAVTVGTLNFAGDDTWQLRGDTGVTDATLTFSGSSGGTAFINVSSRRLITIAGNTGLKLVFASDVVLTTNDNPISYSTSPSWIQMLAPISGAGDLYKAGVGRLTLGANNAAWSGDIHLLAGRTEISGSDSLGTGTIQLDGGATLAGTQSLTLANRIEVGPGKGFISAAESSVINNFTLSGLLVVAGNDPDRAVQFGVVEGTYVDTGTIVLSGTTLVTGLGGFYLRTGSVLFGNADAAMNYFTGLSDNAFVHVARSLNTMGFAATIKNLDLEGGSVASHDGPLILTINYTASTCNQSGNIIGTAGADSVVVNVSTNFDFKPVTFMTWISSIDTITLNGSSADNVLGGANVWGTIINGNDGNDALTGGSAQDVLDGGDGNDLLTGGPLPDTLRGGAGIDTLSYSWSTAAGGAAGVTVSLNDNTASGGHATGDIISGFENLTGSAFSDSLTGDAGANFLDGGSGGADTLIGLGGDDTYIVDSDDTVVEVADGGNDLVTARISHALSAGAEVETLSTANAAGTGAIGLTGNAFGQTLIGNAGNNFLDGGGGADSLNGGAGNDVIIVDSDDQVVEAVGGGNDLVAARTSYALNAGAEVETLSTTWGGGTEAIGLTGNAFGQTIIGNAGANFLDGGGGADTLNGGAGNDLIIVDADDQVVEAAGGGNDLVAAQTSYALNAGAEVETLSTTWSGGSGAIGLTGNEFGQTLIGNAGNNFLDGGGGADILQGLGGNDTYIVDNAGDQVLETAGGGNDLVAAWAASYALNAGAEVETLSTVWSGGSEAINLTGNEFAQTIIGNAGDNVLDGGGGADSLQGLGGADSFAFTTALGGGNVDAIVDFVHNTDKIALDDATFGAGIGTPGAFNANAFVTGTAAGDADDRIIYNSATGQLYYDADGIGGTAQVLFATLQGNPVLSASDFAVI